MVMNDLEQVVGHGEFIITGSRMRRVSSTTIVRSNNSIATEGERSYDMSPLIRSIRVAVDEQKGTFLLLRGRRTINVVYSDFSCVVYKGKTVLPTLIVDVGWVDRRHFFFVRIRVDRTTDGFEDATVLVCMGACSIFNI